jgi:hypothetical protein
MRRLESLLQTDRDALAAGQVVDPEYWRTAQGGAMKPRWRKILVEWLMQFPGEMAISNFSVAVAVNMMDRYLSRARCEKAHYQLVALLCAFIASKLHDSEPLTMSEVVEISSGTYSVEALKRTELAILQTLEWKLLPATAQEIARELLKTHCAGLAGTGKDGDVQNAADEEKTQLQNAELARLTPLSDVCLDVQMLDASFLRYRAPTLAAVAALVALRAAGVDCARSAAGAAMRRHAELRPTNEEVRECHARMWRLLVASFPHLERHGSAALAEDKDRSESPTSVADLEAHEGGCPAQPQPAGNVPTSTPPRGGAVLNPAHGPPGRPEVRGAPEPGTREGLAQPGTREGFTQPGTARDGSADAEPSGFEPPAAAGRGAHGARGVRSVRSHAPPHARASPVPFADAVDGDARTEDRRSPVPMFWSHETC